MRKLFVLIFVLSFGLCFSQSPTPAKSINFTEFKKVIQKGVVIIEFNAPFNRKNTLIMFNNGVKEEIYRANIMLQLPISLFDLQKDIDKLYLNRF